MRTLAVLFVFFVVALGVVVGIGRALQRALRRRDPPSVSPRWIDENVYDQTGDPHPW